MSIFNLFRKPKASFVGHRAIIADEVTGSPQRLKARLERLEKSVKRAEGERRESLEKEITRIREYLEAMREALG